MSGVRQLPQHPGHAPTPTSEGEGERSFAYPTYSGHPPPFERHRSYPIQYISHPPPHERQYLQHPPPPGPYGADEDGRKKRARGESMSDQISPRRQSTAKTARQESMSSETRPNAPSVLVREKKQKACSNCRRAKLKCILNDGESECVRCKSRSERCVFFPRSHDEDWQQTITQDVYSAMSHLSSISQAVSHMVNHLVSQNIIPPLPHHDFPSGGVPAYEMPDRDMTVLQGWHAEKNKDEDPRKRGPGGLRRSGSGRRPDGLDLEDIEDDGRLGIMVPPPNGHGHSQTWSHIPPPHHLPPPHHAGMLHHLPPYRAPGHPGQVQLTPTSELDLPPRHQPFPFPPLAPSPSASGSMQPPLSAGPLPQMPGQHLPEPSPQSIHSLPNVTPNSLIASSISPNIHINGLPPTTSHDPASIVAHPHHAEEVDVDVLTGTKTSPPQPVPAYDEDGNVIIGSADGRNNIVKQGLLSPQEATMLVNHFHENMTPFLFGYQLEFGRFPYLSDGPPSITPFILGVLCMLSSERIPQFRPYLVPLRAYVSGLLRSPAESWQNIATSQLEHNTDEKNDVLDPELGIGPEEIVGACILATYMYEDNIGERAQIADMAFKWARGWIKLLTGGPRWTFAENLGIVPQERKAEWQDMSRIWLLCYVVELTHVEERERAVKPDVHDPTFYCESLIKPEDPPEQASHYDVILVHRAKLVAIIRRWNYRSVTFWNNGPNASFDLKRLANSTNERLDEWQASFARYNHMTHDESRQLVMFYDSVRVLNNAFAAEKLLPKEMKEEATRRACLSKAVTAGLEYLQLANEYSPRQLANLPAYDLRCLTTVLEFLVQACGTGHGYDVASPKNALRPLETHQIRPHLSQLADKFDKRHDETCGHVHEFTGDALRSLLVQLDDVCPN